MKKLCVLFLFLFSCSVALADPSHQEMTSSYRVVENEETNSSNPSSINTLSPITQIALLQSERERYQKLMSQPWEDIPRAKLKYRANNPTVLLVRERLLQTGDLLPENNTGQSLFDNSLKMAVEQFQERHGLKVDGVIGSATLNELNIKPEYRVHQIEVNIQRLQQLSTELTPRYILVNVPEFKLHLIDNGQEVLTMKAIVGKSDWQTPEVTSKITRVIFNPSWHVPTKIAMNDIIPKAADDPYYLDDMRIKVYINHGDGKKQVNHNDINWAHVQNGSHPYLFRQEPGSDNSLGVVKFEFPNEHNVYLHDTPAKSLFDQDKRALSHGCIRLERPLDLASYLVQDDLTWDSDKTQAVLESHKTTYVRLKQPIPIFITYLTVFVDNKGLVNYRNDIYEKDVQEPLPEQKINE